MTALTTAQRAALEHVSGQSSGPPLAPGTALTLNFHPDVEAGGRTLLQAWADEPVYRSQFVTRTSNGGRTAAPEGDRWRWESRMFGGAYDAVGPEERPIYGALNLFAYPYGAAVRFGSAHLVLTPDLLERSTFCYPDSTLEPEAVGTVDRAEVGALARRGVPDRLDDYVEAQVHGLVRLSDAVELVLDPSFRPTAVARAAEVLTEVGLTVRWHAGFMLSAERLEELVAYRGPAVVALGRTLARDGILTPAILGMSHRDRSIDPHLLKQLWHGLARFGYADPLDLTAH